MFRRTQSFPAPCKSQTPVLHYDAPVTDWEPRSLMVSPEVRAAVQEDGVVFLHLRRGIVFRCNRIGALVWEGLARRRNLSEIARQIAAEYGVSVPQAARDAAAFVAQLEAQDFLQSARG